MDPQASTVRAHQSFSFVTYVPYEASNMLLSLLLIMIIFVFMQTAFRYVAENSSFVLLVLRSLSAI
jgi:hypothetical protein